MRAAYSTSNAVRLRNTARQDGTAKAKKRAGVAVVRKLAVLLLTLWKSR